MSILNWISLYLLFGLFFQWAFDKAMTETGGWRLASFIVAVFFWPLPVATTIYQMLFTTEAKRAAARERLKRMADKLEEDADEAERDDWGNRK